MFERFTERGRQVVVLAQEEAARTLKHNHIGTEHLLLGLLREEEGLAAQVLGSLDITVERVRPEVIRIVGSGAETISGQIPFTPRAKKVLEFSLREALSLRHNYIGTEHLLLGLVRENEGVATRILLDLDASAEKIRQEVIRRLEQQPSRGAERHLRAAEPDGPRTDRPPVSDAASADLAGMPDEALTELIDQLAEREQAVSDERRILHGKLDILRAELVDRRRRRGERGQ